MDGGGSIIKKNAMTFDTHAYQALLKYESAYIDFFE